MHWGTENKIICKDNSAKVLSWNNSLYFDDEGNFEAVMSIGIDITKLKESEEALEEQIKTLSLEKEKQRFLLNNLTSIVIETDGKELIDANERLLDFFGYKNIKEYKKEEKCICQNF